MKYISAKNSPTILTVAGLGLGLFSFSSFVIRSPNTWSMVISASALAILAKAVVEITHPSNEWWKMFLRTFVLMFFYALFMPAWSKLELPGTISNFLPQGETFARVVMICLLTNPIIAVAKLFQFLIQHRKS